MRIPTPILRIVVNLTRLQSDRRRRPRKVVCVEPLESRALLASFTVAPNAIFADGQEGSLRAAIMIANTNGEDDLITLQPGKYFLNLTQRGTPTNDPENEGHAGDLDFTESGKKLIIQGTFSETGERPEIIGLSAEPSVGGLNEGVQDRLMHVHSGVTVVLRDITLRGGVAQDNGFDKEADFVMGGAILSTGDLTLRRVGIEENQAVIPPSNGERKEASGGGVAATFGKLTVVDSVINDNEVKTFADAARGGGIYVRALCQLKILRSKIIRNTVAIRRATFDKADAAEGGGIFVTGVVQSQPGLLHNLGSEVVIEKSLIQGNRVSAGGNDLASTTAEGIAARGGGLHSELRQLTIIESTISNNQVQGAAGPSMRDFVTDTPNRGATGSKGGVASGGGISLSTIRGPDTVDNPFLAAPVRLIRSSVMNNVVQGGEGGKGANARDFLSSDIHGGDGGSAGGGFGGGVATWLPLEVINSTIARNNVRGGFGGNGGKASPLGATATGGRGGDGGVARGGGIAALWFGASVGIFNSTVVENAVLSLAGGRGGSGPSGSAPGPDGPAGDSEGGGIHFSEMNVRLVIQSSIVAKNSAETQGPDLFGQFDSADFIGRSLVGINSGTNLLPAISANGDGSRVGSASAPLDPLLQNPEDANHGGPTSGFFPLPGSPVIDAGSDPLGLLTDQRGFGSRVVGAAADMGAVEVGALSPRVLAFGLDSKSSLTHGLPHLRVLNADGTPRFAVHQVFDRLRVSGVHVAVGDVTADGFDDVVAASGAGATSRIVVYDGRTGAELSRFRAYSATFTAGVFVAVGNVVDDTKSPGIEIVVSGKGRRVRIYRPNGEMVNSLQPFEEGFAGRVTVAAGRLDDGPLDSIVVGAADPTAPANGRVRVFSGDGVMTNEFLPTQRPSNDAATGLPNLAVLPRRITVNVMNPSSRDFQPSFKPAEILVGDGRAEVSVDGARNGSNLRRFRKVAGSYIWYDTERLIGLDFPNYRDGVRCAVVDRLADGNPDVIIAKPPGFGAEATFAVLNDRGISTGESLVRLQVYPNGASGFFAAG